MYLLVYIIIIATQLQVLFCAILMYTTLLCDMYECGCERVCASVIMGCRSGEKDQCNNVTRKWAKDKAEWLKREEH